MPQGHHSRDLRPAQDQLGEFRGALAGQAVCLDDPATGICFQDALSEDLLSAWETRSPLVMTAASAVVRSGPTFSGLLGPVVTSITQMARA